MHYYLQQLQFFPLMQVFVPEIVFFYIAGHSAFFPLSIHLHIITNMHSSSYYILAKAAEVS